MTRIQQHEDPGSTALFPVSGNCCVSGILLIVVMLLTPAYSAAQINQESCVYPNGDTNQWGWDNVARESCPPIDDSVSSSNNCVYPNNNTSEWGWDDLARESCPPTVSTMTDSTNAADCIDTNPVGDGWGWNGTSSCRVVDNIEPVASNCIDTDPVGDGWGWDGTASCRVNVNIPPIASTCVDTDPVGDGWGWNGNQSCRVEQPELTTQVNHPMLNNPNEAVNVIRQLADFRARVKDNTNGGFYSYLKSDASLGLSRNPVTGSGWLASNKSFITQTRDVYGFARAFAVTGDLTYLDNAQHAQTFLQTHGQDPINGGWYFVGDRQGRPADCPDCNNFWNPNEFKWSFVQHYVPLGFGALCEATPASEACNHFSDAVDLVDTMWDEQQLGYFHTADADFSNPRDKSFASNIDALNTHAFMNAAFDNERLVRVTDLASIAADRFVGSMQRSNVRFGFPDVFTTDWQITDDQTGSVGHLLKASWMLARAYSATGNNRYRSAAELALDEALNNGGWDSSNGVPYTSFNWSTGDVDQTRAEYWQIEQAVTAGLTNWYISNNESKRKDYLSMADSALAFFVNNVIDWSNGGTYAMNSVDGTVTNSDKGNSYKAEFHSIELFYYTYLYGKLLLRNEPVTLYYFLSPQGGNTGDMRLVELPRPIEIENEKVTLLSAELNETPLNIFDSSSRLLQVAATDSGVLKVTLGPAP